MGDNKIDIGAKNKTVENKWRRLNKQWVGVKYSLCLGTLWSNKYNHDLIILWYNNIVNTSICWVIYLNSRLQNKSGIEFVNG